LSRISLKKIGRFLGDVFFPPVCIGCSRRVRTETVLCRHCRDKVHFIKKPYCHILGTPFHIDLGDGFLSGEAIADPPPFDHARAAVLHKGLAQRMASNLKFGGRTELAPIMARWMRRAGRDIWQNTDFILPMPLHKRRFWQRGYNQSAELARCLARQINKPFAPQILFRKKYTMPQIGLSAKARARNMRGVFAVRTEAKEQINGKNILLIDDVYTTGATAKAAARALKQAGAAEVNVLTFSRAVKDAF